MSKNGRVNVERSMLLLLLLLSMFFTAMLFLFLIVICFWFRCDACAKIVLDLFWKHAYSK